MKRALIPALLIAWAILNLWPLVSHLDQAPMPRVVQDSDFLISHLPFARYVHDNLAEYGHIPLWNASIMSGQPFAADRLSGLWYFPNWLAFWQPQTWMYTLLFLLHLVWTGWGFFLLMKAEGVRPAAAFFAALAWMATPRLIGYVGGGLVTMVFAVSWTPWLLLALRKAARQPSLWNGTLAGASLAVTFLADVQWGIYAGIFAAAYALANFQFSWALVRKTLPVVFILVLFCLALTAGLSLPMLEFMGYSRRAALGGLDAGSYAIQPMALAGMLLPQYGLVYELVVYTGIVPLVLGVLGAVRRKFFWLAAALVAALFACGPNAFLYPLLDSLLHFSGWLRVPSRTWFIVAFCLVALSAWGLDGLLNSLAALRQVRWLAPLAAIALTILSAANLLWYNASQISSVPLPESPLAVWLQSQPGPFRVYSPDGSIPALSTLQQANGVNPMHLATYASYLSRASGMDLPGYSVSLPNIYVDPSTPPDIVAMAAHPDPAALGLLNVKYIISAIPIQSASLEAVQSAGGRTIYQNLDFKPRAWLEGGQASISSWSPDRIELTSQGPAGTLVLSEVMYPGWQAWVDGVPQPIVTYAGLLRSLALPAGSHQVVFSFQPATVLAGAWIAGIGWLAFFGLLVIVRFHIRPHLFSSPPAPLLTKNPSGEGGSRN